MKYFTVELSPIHNKYIVLPNHTKLGLTSTKGSYAVLGARLMNLSYANYLKMCRDVYGATLIGKNHLYINVLFPTEAAATQLANKLDSQVMAIKHALAAK